MKLNYLLSLFVSTIILISSCDCFHKDEIKPNTVTISGEITNPAGDSVWITIASDGQVYGTELDSLGLFKLEFNIPMAGEATFSDGNEVGHMYLFPRDKLDTTIDTKEFDESIKFEGKGSEVNNYLAAKYLEFDDNGAFYVYSMRDSLGIDGGFSYLNSLKEDRLNLLEKHKIQNKGFINWEKTNIEFEYPSLLFQYTYNRSSDSNYDAIYQVFGSYMSIVPLDSLSPQYRYYLRNYGSYLYHENKELLNISDNEDSLIFELIISTTNGYARNKLIATKFESSLDNYDIDFYNRYSNIFNYYLSNIELKKSITEKYNKTKKLLETKLPEGAILINLENEKYSNLTYQKIINRYKGKVIYLDFWASWCGPCKGEMPYSLDLQEYFNNKEVAFVYFSSDKDSTAWKSLIKILQITGDHYRLSKDVRKVTNAAFDVKYIPRYVLFDKNGNVIDANAKRPSNPEIITEIEALL
ncbi:MAG: TlpA family protein disulfide reductase [Bacteroidetes bacterium]|nr:TlpA family protein disulfide reductase [Bacteroidota bacterium]